MQNTNSPINEVAHKRFLPPKAGTIPCDPGRQCVGDEFLIDVEILEERIMMGRRDYKVRPRNGKGERWVSAARVKENK